MRSNPTSAAPSLTTLVCVLALAAGCVFPRSASTTASTGSSASSAVTGLYTPAVPTSHRPFTTFHASWKMRMSAGYAYLEHRGHYNEARSMVSTLVREARAQGLTLDGPPFVLFYDDPAQKPVSELVARIAVPIAGQRSPSSPLRYDVLPEANVAYAAVSGPYPAVPEAYPHLSTYLERFNWELAGPIREIYVVPPSSASNAEELLCEVQFPVATRR